MQEFGPALGFGLLLLTLMTLGKSVSLTKPRFPSLLNGHNNT